MNYLAPPEKNTVLPPTQKNQLLVREKIDGIYSSTEPMSYEEILGICQSIHIHAIKATKSNGSFHDATSIKNILVELALDILVCYQKKELAEEILQIANTPIFLGGNHVFEAIYHNPSAFRHALSSTALPGDPPKMVRILEVAIDENPDFKCAACFLGIVLKHGVYNVRPNLTKAEKYLLLAAERGYQPRFLRKHGQEYQLMRQAQQDKNSIFYQVPIELIRYITHLRVEATRKNSLNKLPAIKI